jgi:hypothetical protein
MIGIFKVTYLILIEVCNPQLTSLELYMKCNCPSTCSQDPWETELGMCCMF